MNMSVLVLLFFTVGYIQVSEAKEHLSLTDFLLDFLLSLWVPPNYAPSKFTRSIHDVSTKEQMISIEKSKMALDNYINHLLRYARENTYNSNVKTNDLASASSAYMCNNPEHQHFYADIASVQNSDDTQGLINQPNDFVSHVYDRNVQPSGGYSIYGNQEEAIENINIISGLNICPPSENIVKGSDPYGCQSKRNAKVDEGILQGRLLNYPELTNRKLLDLSRRPWPLHYEPPSRLNPINRLPNSQPQKVRSDPIKNDVSETTSLVSPRHASFSDNLMSPQEIHKNKIPSPSKLIKDKDMQMFEEWYLPGFLDEIMKNPPRIPKTAHPIHNFPTTYNYNDFTDSMVANHILDTKLGPQGSLIGAMSRFDKPSTSFIPTTKSPERKIDKKSEKSTLISPVHRFGDINSKTTKSDKETPGYSLKPIEAKSS